MSEQSIGKRCIITERSGMQHEGKIEGFVPLSDHYLDDEARGVYAVRADNDPYRTISYPIDMIEVIHA